MSNLKWLAALPFLGILIGTAFVNSVEPLVLGLPLVLAWLVGWVILTAAIMALIFVNDPANAESAESERGAER
jgi:xanthosine utilization system XapX-like protein